MKQEGTERTRAMLSPYSFIVGFVDCYDVLALLLGCCLWRGILCVSAIFFEHVMSKQ